MAELITLSAAPGIIAAIVCLLAQSYYRQPQNAQQLSLLTDYNNTFLRCTQYIDAHYKETISLTPLPNSSACPGLLFARCFPSLPVCPPTSTSPKSGYRKRKY